MTTLFDILEEDISTTLAQIGLTSVEQVDGNALASTPEPHGDDRDVPERLVELAHTAKG
jgi:hypothetical protein